VTVTRGFGSGVKRSTTQPWGRVQRRNFPKLPVYWIPTTPQDRPSTNLADRVRSCPWGFKILEVVCVVGVRCA
jgi:hypothetical protein